MRFLIDAQLPIALAYWLNEHGHAAEHVVDCGLGGADGCRIWEHAVSTGAVIVSKDEDFRSRRTRNTEGPAVVWIRLGNASRRETLRWFVSVFPDVIVALGRGDTLVGPYGSTTERSAGGTDVDQHLNSLGHAVADVVEAEKVHL